MIFRFKSCDYSPKPNEIKLKICCDFVNMLTDKNVEWKWNHEKELQAYNVFNFWTYGAFFVKTQFYNHEIHFHQSPAKTYLIKSINVGKSLAAYFSHNSLIWARLLKLSIAACERGVIKPVLSCMVSLPRILTLFWLPFKKINTSFNEKNELETQC